MKTPALVALLALTACSSANGSPVDNVGDGGKASDASAPPGDAATSTAEAGEGGSSSTAEAGDAGSASTVVALSASQAFACALTRAGSVKCWTPGSTTPAATVTGLPSDLIAVAAGGNALGNGYPFICVIAEGGDLQCQGSLNAAGQLGNGSIESATGPVQVVGLTSGVTSISAGGGFVPASCAVAASGAVECWGTDDFGQLGNGIAMSAEYSDVPVAVTGLPSGVSAVSMGGTFACALASGSVWCWGDDTLGQLGDGNTTTSENPVQVTGLSGVTAVAADVQQACAIVAGGAVECWGSSTFAETGDSGAPNRLTPVALSGLSGVTGISASGGTVCVITASGGVECWGLNNMGQLGNGTTTDSVTPVQVTGLTSGVATVAVGFGFACASTASGAVACWGDGYGATPMVVPGFP